MKMSYQRLGNTRIRFKTVRDGKIVGRKRDIFDKVNEIKRDIKAILPEIKSDELIGMLSRCRNYYFGNLHYGRRGPENKKRKRELTINERILYDYLLKNNLNPSTTYRWFIATRLPQDIREKLAKGKIGQKQAMQIAANRRRTKNSTEGLLMMEEIRSIIQKLDWR